MTANSKLGEVFTYRKQEPVNKGFGYFDPEKVFFREDENGKVIIDGKRCIIVNSKDDANFVKIGNNYYSYVKIGDFFITNMNLNETFGIIEIDGAFVETEHAWTGNDGLLYNFECVETVNENLPEGWRVPTRTDLSSILAAVSEDTTIRGKLLKTEEYNGTNDYNFDGKCTGNMNSSGSFINNGTTVRYWLNNDSNSDAYFLDLTKTRDDARVLLASKLQGLNIRLVKDRN